MHIEVRNYKRKNNMRAAARARKPIEEGTTHNNKQEQVCTEVGHKSAPALSAEFSVRRGQRKKGRGNIRLERARQRGAERSTDGFFTHRVLVGPFFFLL